MTGEPLSQEQVDRRFIDQIRGDSRRVAYCAPGHDDQVRAILEANGFGDAIEVRENPFILDDHRVVVVDEQASEAARAAWRQKRFGG